jgi:hypothetical protein
MIVDWNIQILRELVNRNFQNEKDVSLELLRQRHSWQKETEIGTRCGP